MLASMTPTADNFNARLESIASDKLGSIARIVRFETDAKGWPVPQWSVIAPHADFARRLGLDVCEVRECR